MKTDVRNNALDSLKFFAAFVIYTGHFMTEYNVSLDRLMPTVFFWLLFKGITGKFGLAVFGVILGYFAITEGKKMKYTISDYTIKRYIYFVICGLFINGLFAILYKYPLTAVFLQSFTLGGNIYNTFWCLPALFTASIIGFFIGRSDISFSEALLLSAVFYICGNLWVCISLFGGALIIEYAKKPLWQNRLVRIAVFLISFFIIKRDESVLTYLLDGITAAVWVILLENSDCLNRFMSNSLTSSLGKNSMAFFLIHVIIYKTAGKKIFDYCVCRDVKTGLAAIITYFICLALISVLSFPTCAFLRFCTNKTMLLCKGIQARIHNSLTDRLPPPSRMIIILQA